MPVLPTLGRVVGLAIRGTRHLVRGAIGTGRWVGRRVDTVRTRGAAGEAGMMRLFDLHAASCAGDTLVTIGLAGTIFFSAPLGEARSKVALYLLVTMVPFALLAPVVGPLLDHFRHGRRYALAATMLGRAFLAWLISDYLDGFGLYPAAFGVLALSRAYGVARSAAVPRLLPAGLGLSQAGARASVYGTIAGAAAAPLGAAAFWVGPQWPLRVASVIFLIGMVTALRLPPRADSDPPETLPRPFTVIGFRRGGDKALTGSLVFATLTGSATLRALYGFLFLFLAFEIKAGTLSTELLGANVGDAGALAVVGGALAVGTFLATAAGTRLNIHRPAALQSNGLIIVAGLAVLATIKFSLTMVALLCLVTAAMSGVSKLAVDATIQERIDERLRASAFAHSETLLMLAFVAGGALGLIPFPGHVGVGVAAAFSVLAAVRAVIAAGRLRKDRLNGRALADTTDPGAERQGGRAGSRPTGTTRESSARRPADAARETGAAPETAAQGPADTGTGAGRRAGAGEGASAGGARESRPKRRFGRTRGPAPAPPAGRSGEPDEATAGETPAPPPRTPEPEDDQLAPPGYHIYRPSSAADRGDSSRRGPAGPKS